MVAIARLVNPRGDLFATAFAFSGQALIRLVSSLILTRILAPRAYGIIAILTSIAYLVEMISDVGGWVPLIRHPLGDEAKVYNTAWTIRFLRSFLNGTLLLALAPAAASLYASPTLTLPLRVMSLTFFIGSLESVSFPLAIRKRNARIIVYSELLATGIGGIFAIVYCLFSRTFWGVLYGILVNRAVMTGVSYCFYRGNRPKLRYDKSAGRELLSYSRFAIPSSLLTVSLSQFDKVVFLRFFNLTLLGIYGVASGISASVDGLIGKITQLVLYPRCAHNFRVEPDKFVEKYYRENVKLLALLLLVPAAIGGAAPLLIRILYDSRYAMAGVILQAFMIRAILSALASAAESMLVASGESSLILISNIYRVCWAFTMSLLGYFLFGFLGFVYGFSLSTLPKLAYYLVLQHRKGFMIPGFELQKVAAAAGTFAATYIFSAGVMRYVPAIRIHFL